jgi:hypothetical protein
MAHNTRSKGDAKPFLSVDDRATLSSQISYITESNNNDNTISSQTIKTDIDTLPDRSPPSPQSASANPAEIISFQKHSLENDRQVNDRLQEHEIAINKLTKLFDRLNLMNNTISSIEPTTSLLVPSTVCTQLHTTSTTDETTKHLRSKQMSQLFESTPFSGSRTQDVVDWLDEFNGKCNNIKLDNTHRLSVARGLMTGDAKLWEDTVKNTLIDWKTFQQKLTTYFQLACGIDCFSFGEQLYTRQQQLHESATHYYRDVMRLCSKVDINMDNNTRLKHLYRGLRRETKVTMDIRKFNDPDEFSQELVRLEQLQKDFETEEQQPYQQHHQQHHQQQPSQQQQPYQQPSQQQQPYQQHYRQQPYQQHHQQQPYQQHHQQQPYQQHHRTYPFKSSSQYRNQQSSSSKYDNRHLNGW